MNRPLLGLRANPSQDFVGTVCNLITLSGFVKRLFGNFLKFFQLHFQLTPSRRSLFGLTFQGLTVHGLGGFPSSRIRNLCPPDGVVKRLFGNFQNSFSPLPVPGTRHPVAGSRKLSLIADGETTHDWRNCQAIIRDLNKKLS